MDDLQSTEESAFLVEEVEKIAIRAIEGELKDKEHDEDRVAMWIDSICEICMKDLVELCKPFKYIVSCCIMQRNGAGLHSSSSAHLDTVYDGMVTVKWPGERSKEQNKTLYCIVNVVGLHF